MQQDRADRHRRHARQGPGAGADDGHARASAEGRRRPAPEHAKRTFKYSARQRSDVHAAPRLRGDVQHARPYERQFGAATFAVKSRARIKGHGDLTSKTSSPATARCSAPPPRWPDRSRCCSSNDIEPITLEGLDITITHGRDAAQRHHRARLARRHPAARRADDAAQGPDPQLPRRGEDLDRADRDSRRTPRAACRFWSPTAVS